MLRDLIIVGGVLALVECLYNRIILGAVSR